MVYWGGTPFSGNNVSSGSDGGLDMDALSHLMKVLGIGSGAATAAGGAYNYLTAGKNDPAKAAAPYLNQIPQVANQYLQPYSQAGQDAIGQLQPQYSQLLNDTGGKYNQLASGFTESPGYQFRLKESLRAANNMAASKGMAGTPQHERYRMETAGGLASQDFENYLGHILGLYGSGLQGQQGMMQGGQHASGDLANILATNLSHQAQAAAESQAAKNRGRSAGFGGLIKGATQILPWLFG